MEIDPEFWTQNSILSITGQRELQDCVFSHLLDKTHKARTESYQGHPHKNYRTNKI